jgi:phosphopantetheinyl transferase (holo-ACP synthase)
MNTIGIGIDATHILRIDQALKRFGDRFAQRVFAEAERVCGRLPAAVSAALAGV